jgi:hypothetical protein
MVPSGPQLARVGVRPGVLGAVVLLAAETLLAAAACALGRVTEEHGVERGQDAEYPTRSDL